MKNADMPMMTAASYGTSTDITWSENTTGATGWGPAGPQGSPGPLAQEFQRLAQQSHIDYRSPQRERRIVQTETSIESETHMSSPNRRIVQVFIADPNENVPLEESVLFKGDQKLTDATDTELFFEVPIADILKTHNEKRVKLLDKDATKKAGKDVLLDPVKIRELKMVVVTIASF
jgi:hypothetical protein